jgi:hypothetical protein
MRILLVLKLLHQFFQRCSLGIKGISHLHMLTYISFPMVTSKISPSTNVTLTLGWITLFMGDMGEGVLHREDEVTVKQRN